MMRDGCLVFTNSFQAARRKNNGRIKRVHLHLHSICQNLVMWSHLAAKEAGKCFPLAEYINDVNKIKVILLGKKRTATIESLLAVSALVSPQQLVVGKLKSPQLSIAVLLVPDPRGPACHLVAGWLQWIPFITEAAWMCPS